MPDARPCAQHELSARLDPVCALATTFTIHVAALKCTARVPGAHSAHRIYYIFISCRQKRNDRTHYKGDSEMERGLGFHVVSAYSSSLLSAQLPLALCGLIMGKVEAGKRGITV